MGNVKRLVALDWGTSSLRAALLDEHGQVREERSLPRGILTVPAGGFPEVFAQITAQWPAGPGTLVLVAGMAGSRQGWQEAPYCPCPAGLADIAVALAWIDAGRIAIVPGLSCEDRGVPDVMRGEETQVFGAMQLLDLHDGVFVLPGTHSKWVRVAGGRIEGFSTFMTGEAYALLRQHSILARMLPAVDSDLDEQAFERGVRHALASANLLRAAFSVRTLLLFDRMPAEAMTSYLSGLLVGEELRSQDFRRGADAVVIVAAPALAQRYEMGLRLLGVPSRVVGCEATWRGLWAIAQAR